MIKSVYHRHVSASVAEHLAEWISHESHENSAASLSNEVCFWSQTLEAIWGTAVLDIPTWASPLIKLLLEHFPIPTEHLREKLVKVVFKKVYMYLPLTTFCFSFCFLEQF